MGFAFHIQLYVGEQALLAVPLKAVNGGVAICATKRGRRKMNNRKLDNHQLNALIDATKPKLGSSELNRLNHASA